MRRGPEQRRNHRRGLDFIEQAFNAHDPEFLRGDVQGALTVLADCIRSMIRDPSGAPIVVADYASIEVVVLWWVAGASA